jgi:hypothetical protein
MRRELTAIVAVGFFWACGGQTQIVTGDAGGDGASSSSSGSSSGGSSGGSGGSSGSSSGGSSGGSSGSSSGGSSGSSSGGNHEVPTNHRPNDDQCLQAAPAGSCNGQGGGGPGPGSCSSDAQCSDAGPNGRCVESGGGALFCSCTYDMCADDAACPTGQTCACHGSLYNNSGNTCVAGNCRVDSDCEGGAGYCSPAYAPMGCGGLAGYYCHTPQDQCVNDSDCSNANGQPVCTYSTSESRWTCQQLLLCG